MKSELTCKIQYKLIAIGKQKALTISFNTDPGPAITGMLRQHNWYYDGLAILWRPTNQADDRFIELLLPEAIEKVNNIQDRHFNCPHCKQLILVEACPF